MNKSDVKSTASIEMKVTLVLTEVEARALYAITTFGLDDFKKVFYEHLGSTDLKPVESGLVPLWSTLRGELPKHFRRVNNARLSFEETLS